MAMPYGNPPVYFTQSMILVLMNRVFGVVFAVTMVAGRGELIKNSAPAWKYFLVSVSTVFASVCQYEALKYVSFPVQMLGKSFKMLPVMMWSIIVSRKTYPPLDWAVAFMVTAGITMFLASGPTGSPVPSTGEHSFVGVLLLLVFLAFDGFTSTFQEKLFREHNMSKYNQMFYINLGACLISSLCVTLLGGGFTKALDFIIEHPGFVFDSSLLSTSAVASQWFIYSQVEEFGALVLAATMNVRQVCSILVSYASFGHVMTPLQAVGVFCAFTALSFKSVQSLKRKPSNQEEIPIVNKDHSSYLFGGSLQRCRHELFQPTNVLVVNKHYDDPYA